MDSARSDKTTLLEVCVDDAAGLAAAIEGGADRIELCSALSVGGLTPTHGFMALAARAPIPVFALIRPRAGSFVFDARDVAIMREDIAAARQMGLAGVVIGASRHDGRLDETVLGELVSAADGLGLTLHRAFDLVPDSLEALEVAIGLGFRRILTSGGQKTALAGLDTLRAVVAAAGSRLSVMPGGGLKPDMAATFLSVPGISELHASCGKPVHAAETRLVELGFLASDARQTDSETVRAFKAAMELAAS